jgi:hypothetical protein
VNALVDALTDTVLHALSKDQHPEPLNLTFLLRRYAETGRDDLRAALEAELGRALEAAAGERDCGRSAEWLSLFVETARLAEDDRVLDACDRIALRLQDSWRGDLDVESSMQSIEACLMFGVVGPAVDELERIVGGHYRPGAGMANGDLGVHVRTASALLTAHALTGRLPYAMLAEELIQFARRTWGADGFRSSAFALNCAAAHVLCRIAHLRQDPEYREAAVTAGFDYAADAEQVMSSLAAQYQDHPEAPGSYGLAVQEWLAVRL